MNLFSIISEMFTPDPFGPKGRKIRIESSIKSMTEILMKSADKGGWDKNALRDFEARMIYCHDVIIGASLTKEEIKDLERILKSRWETAWIVSSNEGSWLSQLEKMFNKDNPFYSHIVPWMQNYLVGLPQPVRRAPAIIFKIAVIPILDAVPSIFPKDLPQTLRDGEWWTDRQLEFINKLNTKIALYEQIDAMLPSPITSNVIFQIIAAAQEYEKEFSQRRPK